MRLLSAILILAGAVAVISRMTAPRVLSIQVNRCPTPDSYSNIQEEEETVSNFVSASKKTIQSEFVETIRFMANESGTVQFFVVGRGNFSVDIEADTTVIEGINGVHHVDGQEGGAVITVPFKVLQGVRETTINITFNTRTIKKTTVVYASTKSLEPPRPPSLYTSLIFSQEDIRIIENLPKNGTGSHDTTELTDEKFPETSGRPSRPLKNGTADATVIDSPYNLQYNPFSSEKNIANSSSSLHFNNLAMNRLSSNQMEVYGNKQFYFLTIKKNEHGQMIFDVSGDGREWVAVKSHKDNTKVWKVMEVTDGRAVLPYRDGAEYVDEDKIVAVLTNGFEERAHIYVHITRVD